MTAPWIGRKRVHGFAGLPYYLHVTKTLQWFPMSSSLSIMVGDLLEGKLFDDLCIHCIPVFLWQSKFPAKAQHSLPTLYLHELLS